MTAAQLDLSRHFARTDGDALRQAFSSRRPLMPWRDKLAVPQAELAAT